MISSKHHELYNLHITNFCHELFRSGDLSEKGFHVLVFVGKEPSLLVALALLQKETRQWHRSSTNSLVNPSAKTAISATLPDLHQVQTLAITHMNAA